MQKAMTALDLFCGGGGFSYGAELTGKVKLRIAVNHKLEAITTHSINFPHAEHMHSDVRKIDLRRLAREHSIDVLIASPECTNHCRAKGGKPYDSQSRATAWQVVYFAEFLQPKFIFVENVFEFTEWGPLDESGRPIKKFKGNTFKAWLDSLRSLGYSVDYNMLNAASFGAHTSRERLFIVARRDGAKVRWPKPEYAEKDWKPSGDIIDWSLPAESIFDRERPLVDNTWKRILYGIEKFWPEPFVTIMRGQSTARSTTNPLPTMTTGGHLYLVEPFTILAKWEHNNAKSIQKPLPTATTKPSLYVVEPFLTKLYGTGKAKPLGIPLDTVTAGGNKFGLIQPFLVQYNGQSKAKPLGRPIGTLTTRDRFGLVRPVFRKDNQDYVLDISYRMLQPHELAAATGLPKDYYLDGGKTMQRWLIGNMVCPDVARALIGENI